MLAARHNTTDIFANPEQARVEIMQDAATMADAMRHYRAAESALGDDIRDAGENHGHDLWEAAKAHAERQVPQHLWNHFQQNLIVQRMNGTDVVQALINQYEHALATTRHARDRGYKLAPGQERGSRG